MVKRKDEVERKVKVVAHGRSGRQASAGEDGPEVSMVRGSRLSRVRRSGGRRGFFVFVFIVILLLLGWFAARAFMSGDGSGNFWSSLLNWRGTKLIGEEDGRVNVLLLGNPGVADSDEGPGLTDTIMVASYNVKDNFLHLFSIPRDLYVEVDNYGFTKINSVYDIGESQNNDGPGTIRKTVEDLTGLAIPYYAKIDFAGFRQVVDELGGVTVTVEKDLYDPFYPAANKGYETLDIKAGTYTMDGDKALKYVRSRKTTSDFDRARRQQQVLLSLKGKAQDLEMLTAPSKVTEIRDIIKDHFSTNLTSTEAERALQLLAQIDPTKVYHKVFDDSATGLLYGTKVGEMFVLKPVNDDYTKIREFVVTALSSSEATTEEPAETEPLTIEVLNGTNITGLAGRIADKLKAAGFTVSRTGNNATKGLANSIVYDGTKGEKLTAVKHLAELLGAELSSETITLPAGVDARVAVGASADQPTQ